MKFLCVFLTFIKGFFTTLADSVMDFAEAFRANRPTPAEREADRQRREQERQQAEAERQQQESIQVWQNYIERLKLYGVEILGRELYSVLQRIYSPLGVMRPLSATNLPAKLHRIAQFPWVVFEVRRQTLDPMERDQLLEAERMIQREIDMDIAAGLVWEVESSYDGGRTPAIICGPLAVLGETLYIPMALTDYSGIRDWWWSRRADQEHPRPPMDVSDERF